MCKLCNRRICPRNCPNFEEDREERAEKCVLCGEAVADAGGGYRMHGFPYCSSCLDAADSDTLVRICETTKRKWLQDMGFSPMEYEDGSRRYV